MVRKPLVLLACIVCFTFATLAQEPSRAGTPSPPGTPLLPKATPLASPVRFSSPPSSSSPSKNELQTFIADARSMMMRKMEITENFRWWVDLTGHWEELQWVAGLTYTYAPESYLKLYWDKRNVAVWLCFQYTP
jgi:hypothetical protein